MVEDYAGKLCKAIFSIIPLIDSIFFLRNQPHYK